MNQTNNHGDVLVGVEDPEHVQQLVRTAGDLARAEDVGLRLVTVVVKPHDSPFGVFDDATIRRDFAGDSQALLEQANPPEGVAVERDVVVARSVEGGLLNAVAESDPAALVVGWQGPTGRVDALLGTTLDTLVARARCDLYVERVGREAGTVESVLLPVAGGPHVEVAARTASAIALSNDAKVVVLSVATTADDIETGLAAKFARDGTRAVQRADEPAVPVETEIRQGEAESVAATVAGAAADHDVVVLGATRKSALRTRFVGSVPRRVVDLTDRTIVLSRAGSVVESPVGRLKGLLERW